MHSIRAALVLVAGMSGLILLAGCGYGLRTDRMMADSGPYQIAMYPYDAQVAEAIVEYAAPLEVNITEDADYDAANFLGKVRWDAQASESLGRPYRYRGQEERRQEREDRGFLGNLFSGFTEMGDNQIFIITSSIQFYDYRTYELPDIKTYDDQETVEIFCRLIAKSAQWIQEGERRAISELEAAKSIRSLEQFQDRIAEVEGRTY